jgi:hypothetical protein
MLDCSLHELFDDVITPDRVLAKKNRILIVLPVKPRYKNAKNSRHYEEYTETF